MKTTIDAAGCLCIVSETPLESFALSRWYQLWIDSKCSFIVECSEKNCVKGNDSLEYSLNKVEPVVGKQKHKGKNM
jgi:hypothetical protein